MRAHVYQNVSKGQARVTVDDRPPERALDVLSIAGPELSRLLIHQRLHERRSTDFMRFTGARLHPSSIAPALPEMNHHSAVDLQRFKIGPLHQSHPRITLRSLNVSGDELDAPHLDVATRLLAHCPYVEPAIWHPLKVTPTEIERVDVGGKAPYGLAPQRNRTSTAAHQVGATEIWTT